MTEVRATKLRLYPTAEQRKQLARSSGAARYVYNWTLALWRGWSTTRALAIGLSAERGKELQAVLAMCRGLIRFHREHPKKCTRVRCRCGLTEHLVAHMYQPGPSMFGVSRLLTALKGGTGVAWDRELFRVVGHGTDTPLPPVPWLAEVSSYVGREAIADVNSAYTRFFRVAKKHKSGDHSECGLRRDGGCALGEPTFRSRSHRAWHADQANSRKTGKGPLGIRAGNHGTAPRVLVPGVGWVRCAGTLPPDGARLSAIGLDERAGNWFAALRYEAALPEQKPRYVGTVTGVETGVRELAVTSSGHRFGAVRDLQALHVAERKLRLWQRRQSRRARLDAAGRLLGGRLGQSAGWHEAVRMVRQYNDDATNARKNLLHQTSRRVVDTGAATLVMRDQAVKRMLGRGQVVREQKAEADGARTSTLPARTVEKRNKLAPMIQQCGGLYELRRQVEYKQQWAGGKTVTAPNSEPTTRMCSQCGVVRETEPPYGVTWKCAGCGAEHDRESNAAQNLKNYAGRKPGAAGGGTHRRKPRKGRTAEITEVTGAVAHPAQSSGSARSERSGKPVASNGARREHERKLDATAIPAGNGGDLLPDQIVDANSERCSATTKPASARSSVEHAENSAGSPSVASPKHGAFGDRSQSASQVSEIARRP